MYLLASSSSPISLFISLFLALPILILVVILRSPKSKGRIGEKRVSSILGKTKDGIQYVINDLLFITNSGKSCQIDHILINQYGIWVVETKNYSGYIYGDDYQEEWLQVLAYGRRKNKFYNPVKQNKTHIYHLSKYLKTSAQIHNVVVFLPGANLSNVNSQYLYDIRSLTTIKSADTEALLSVEQMEEYYNILLQLQKDNTITDKEHINNIRKQQVELMLGICPRCGSELVLRDGKKGQFYGCSNYPKCKFTKRK